MNCFQAILWAELRLKQHRIVICCCDLFSEALIIDMHTFWAEATAFRSVFSLFNDKLIDLDI